MNLLSSSSYFHNKNPFSISFIPFKQSLDWALIPRKVRGLGDKIPKTQRTVTMDGGFILEKDRGSYVKVSQRRGIHRRELHDLK